MELYLYEDLLKAENQDDLLEKTQRVVEKLEYEAFSYIFRSIDKVGKERKQTDCLFGTVPDGWLNRGRSLVKRHDEPLLLRDLRVSV